MQLLRSALDTAGHSDIQIVAPDAQSWDILKAFASDPDFLNSVNIIGYLHFVQKLCELHSKIAKFLMQQMKLVFWQYCKVLFKTFNAEFFGWCLRNDLFYVELDIKS